MSAGNNAILETIRSIRFLLDRSSLRKGKGLLLMTALVSVADVLALAAVIPALMLAIDGDFLSKSRKLRALFRYSGYEKESQFLLALIALVAVFFVLKNIFAVFIQKRIHRLCTRLVQNFTENTFYHLLNQPFERIVRNGSTDFLNKIHFNSMHYATGVLLPFVNIVGESLVILLILVFMVWFNPSIFFLIVLVTAPAFYFINIRIRHKIFELGEQTKGKREETIESLNIGMNGLVDVKVNHSAGFFIRDFLGKQKGLIDADFKSIYYQGIPSRANEIVVLAGVIILVVYGYFFSDNPAGLRALAAVFVLSVFRMVPAINRMLVGVMKIKLYQFTIDFLQHSKPLNKIHPHVHIHFRDVIRVQNLEYKFEDAPDALLENISFEIRKGEVFGITGMSGSGKSTLMKMISGLLLPQKGQISIDGLPLNESNIHAWQNQIGFVHQSPFIFNKTLHENISLSASYDAAKMDKAIRWSGLGKFVEHLPGGLHTLMGEQGSRISEGQKQRIAIARALYKEASVLLFDEATSSLDSETEDIILESIQNLRQEKVTIIIIAHKKRIIGLCDHSFELKEK